MTACAFVGPTQYAMIKAALKWGGRDRRRLKREIAKAAKTARRMTKGPQPEG